MEKGRHSRQERALEHPVIRSFCPCNQSQNMKKATIVIEILQNLGNGAVMTEVSEVIYMAKDMNDE